MPDVYTNLDRDFAARLRQLVAASGGLSITDAFRTRAQQEDLYRRKPNLAARPGHSLHERGLAADLSGNLERAHALAGQYGLEFPMLDPKGSKYEPWHVQLRGAMSNPAAERSRSMPQQPQMMGGAIKAPSFSPSSLGQQTPFGVNDPLLQLILQRLGQQQQQQQPAMPQLTDYNALMPAYSNAAQGEAATRPDPYIEKIAALKGKQAELEHLMQGQRPEEAQYSPFGYSSPPASTQRAIPTRPEPRFDPVSGGLAGLISLLAPEAAGGALQGTLGASMGQAQQEFGDAQVAYNQQLQQDAQAHQDALAAHSQGLEIAKANYEGQAAVKETNRQARNAYQHNQMQLAAAKAGLEPQMPSVLKMQEQEQQHQQAAAKQAALTAILPLIEAKDKRALDVYEALSRDAYQQGSLANQQTNTLGNLYEGAQGRRQALTMQGNAQRFEAGQNAAQRNMQREIANQNAYLTSLGIDAENWRAVLGFNKASAAAKSDRESLRELEMSKALMNDPVIKAQFDVIDGINRQKTALTNGTLDPNSPDAKSLEKRLSTATQQLFNLTKARQLFYKVGFFGKGEPPVDKSKVRGSFDASGKWTEYP